MGMITTHVIGFAVCAIVVALGGKRLYNDSQRDLDAPFDESLPEHYYVVADTVGLGLSIGAYGVEVVEAKTDRFFDSRIMIWIKKMTASWQIQPDGVYFHPRLNHHEWNGYGDEKPLTKLGKFELEA